MCRQLYSCPLCAQPCFESLDSLRIGLVSVATRPLTCPVCNDTVLGIDKLTIHLFGHTIETKPEKIITPEQNNSTWNSHNLQSSNLNNEKIQNSINTRIFQDQNVTNKLQNHDLFLNQSLDIPERQVTLLNSVHKDNDEINVLLENSSNKEKDNSSNQYNNCLNDALQNKNSTNIEQFPSTWNENLLLETCSNESCNKNVENCTKISAEIGGNLVKEVDKFNKLTLDISESCKVPSKDSNITNENKKNSSVNDGDDDNDGGGGESSVLLLPQIKNLRNLTAKKKTERCNICGFNFPDENILIMHKQLVHMIAEKDLNVRPEEVLKNYPCHLCAKIFKMRGSLMVHMRVAHIGYNLGLFPKEKEDDQGSTESGFNCPTCGKNFKKEQHVTQHLKIHEGKQWECDVCSKMFTTKYFLKKHKRLHSGEMPYKCNICEKTFTFQQSYHKHRLYHKDDKPHTCMTCGRSFKELSTLHNHERIHTGEKPFACETCGKCFRQRVSYLVHRRIHTGVMPYTCPACGKNFRYKVSQRTHKCQGQLDHQEHQQSEPQNISSDKTEQLQQPLHLEESNKFILIVNSNGQPVLTREIDMNSTNSSNQIPSIDPRESLDAQKILQSPKNLREKSLNTPDDFFSLVMTQELSSPSAEMKDLRLSSPVTQENYGETLEYHSEVIPSTLQKDIKHAIDGILHERNQQNSLETINEESLKQLLYGNGQKL